LSVVVLVLLSLQSRAEDESIMGIISKLVSKMEEKYPSGDALAGVVDEFKAYQETDTERDQSMQDQVSNQAAEIENVKQSLADAEANAASNRAYDNEQVSALQDQVSANAEDIVNNHQDIETKMVEMQKRIAELESTPSGGSAASSYLWIISNYARNKRNRKKLTSTTFYSSSMGGQAYGYKMQVYAYLHNKGHLSLFFKLLKGRYDDIQEWPFPYHVQFELLPQRSDVGIMRNTTSISDEERANNPDVFGRPTRSNTGWGFTQFIEEKQVEANYLDHDKIYVKVTVV